MSFVDASACGQVGEVERQFDREPAAEQPDPEQVAITRRGTSTAIVDASRSSPVRKPAIEADAAAVAR